MKYEESLKQKINSAKNKIDNLSDAEKTKYEEDLKIKITELNKKSTEKNDKIVKELEDYLNYSPQMKRAMRIYMTALGTMNEEEKKMLISQLDNKIDKLQFEEKVLDMINQIDEKIKEKGE